MGKRDYFPNSKSTTNILNESGTLSSTLTPPGPSKQSFSTDNKSANVDPCGFSISQQQLFVFFHSFSRAVESIKLRTFASHSVRGRDMGQGKVFFVVFQAMVLILMMGSSALMDGKQGRWRKAMISGETRSSVAFQLHGNVYPTGYYNVTVNIGQPSRPYFLDVDTGSDLTWLQCDAPCVQCIEAPHPFYRPSNNLVICKDPLCASLHAPGEHKCENPNQCDYEVEYADGGSSLGVLVRDAFYLNLTNEKHSSPLLALGCGYDQLPGGAHHPLDGILGLGRGKASIISQLSNTGLVRNVIGHCLSGRGGGFLFFGDDLYDSSRVTWTPMSRDHPKHYSPGLAELVFSGKATEFKNLLVAFDSGSSYTYLNSDAYHALISLVKNELSGKPLKEAGDDRTLPLCWKGQRPFKSVHDVQKYFRPLSLRFADGGRTKTQFDIPPESYLILSSKGNICMGILNGTEVGLQNLNVIGDISMQDKLVVYDNENERIGWAPARCDGLPKGKRNII